MSVSRPSRTDSDTQDAEAINRELTELQVDLNEGHNEIEMMMSRLSEPSKEGSTTVEDM